MHSSRGEMTQGRANLAEERFTKNQPFACDRKLPSGRTVTTNVRTVRGGGILPPVAVSSGVSVYPACGTLPQNLITTADGALYLAKADGRNCARLAKELR